MNRQNANRLFDSQNNNRGGYNVGDSNAEQNGSGRGDSLGQMTYYKTEVMQVEWSANSFRVEDTNAEFILQYTCDDMSNTLWDVGGGNGLRDGDGSTNANNGNTNRIVDESQAGYGRHEPQQFFDDCNVRNRNRGLAVFDQNLFDSARSTRQNDGGNGYGFECPEERDYYPYWHPTPWKDAAIFTSDPTRCSYYAANSENVLGRSHCNGEPEYNNQVDCVDNGGTWAQEPSWMIPAPACADIATAKDPNVMDAFSFKWTIPNDISDNARCVVRARLNVSSSDFDGWNTYASNQPADITSDPEINVMGTYGAAVLQVNINTAQMGRTFQDRSHVFIVRDRPLSVPLGATIHSIEVKGRRGNIVQVYPAVEYMFSPRELTIPQGDFVHIHWTGSLSSPDGNGQGAAETDKTNVVCTASAGSVIPLLFSDPACTLFQSLAQHTDFATAGFAGTLATVDDLLNNVPASYDGALFSPSVGDHSFMCTRNTHFSNRAQTGIIHVV